MSTYGSISDNYIIILDSLMQDFCGSCIKVDTGLTVVAIVTYAFVSIEKTKTKNDSSMLLLTRQLRVF